MNKKKVFISVIVIIVILVLVLYFIFFNDKNNSISNQEQNNSISSKNDIEYILEYGNNVEKMDILPNIIIAKLNGKEILFRELETTRKSINYSNSENDKNAFYELLVKKLYVEYAKKYPNEVDYNLNIEQNMEKTRKELTEGYNGKTAEECRKEILETLCIEENELWFNKEDFITYVQNVIIEQMLEAKGISIITKFMLERPELANDTFLEEKVSEYNKLKEKQLELKEQNNVSDMMTSINEATKLLTEIRELYIKDLLLNSDIELCVDKNELYYYAPTVYTENSELSRNEYYDNLTKNVKAQHPEWVDDDYYFDNSSIEGKTKISERKAIEVWNEYRKNVLLQDLDVFKVKDVIAGMVKPTNYFTAGTNNNIKTADYEREAYIIYCESTDALETITGYVDVYTGKVIGGYYGGV